MVSVGNLHWEYPLINGVSIDDVMNVVIWIFLELHFGVELLTWNVDLKLKFGHNKIGKRVVSNLQTRIRFQSHMAKLMK